MIYDWLNWKENPARPESSSDLYNNKQYSIYVTNNNNNI